MTVATDSTIVLDILLNDRRFGDASQALLETHLASGSVLVCPLVFAECAVTLSPPTDFTGVAQRMGLIYDDFSIEVCTLAARMWGEYRKGGGSRSRLMADFMIGAHAQVRTSGLLTRDRGFYRRYFTGLHVIEP